MLGLQPCVPRGFTRLLVLGCERVANAERLAGTPGGQVEPRDTPFNN